MHHSRADSLRHCRSKQERGAEIEEGRPDDGPEWGRTRVETTVAIELAASWKPLMKSKHSATRTITVTSSNVDSMRQECLTATFCKASATSSQLSVVCSRNS